MYSRFQHTAARRRLDVSTASIFANTLFQHTAARRRLGFVVNMMTFLSCFNTQPPEGGWPTFCELLTAIRWFQHTAARRRLAIAFDFPCMNPVFQHTAARRRLESPQNLMYDGYVVSTHSRPKAAGVAMAARQSAILGFNTQPPEGGWSLYCWSLPATIRFQHTAARRRLVRGRDGRETALAFQHTAARRRLV